MPENFSPSDITFKEMSEEGAVKEFQNHGYFDYAKRKMRYRSIPTDSVWATSPATMFVAYYENKPVGVIGFAKYKNVLLGAGVHVRKEYRGRGLTTILIDKLLSEKGSTTLYVNIMNPNISSSYRRKGFTDMQEENLPEDAREAIEGIGFQDQVQKWLVNNSGNWFEEVKKWNGKKF
jgi:GNAT superfamily N-acetyltransferase